MELKNALAVCLISLFSATLVVIIARAFDSQAAARLEPHLVVIAEELQALRKQGGLPVAAGGEALADGLTVYYFHSNTRCPTCQSIESQARDVVQKNYAAELDRGEMSWKVLNYEQPSAAGLARRFDVQVPVVVLARMSGGEAQDWERLDEVWALVDDPPAYAAYVRGEIEKMLRPAGDTAPAGEDTAVGGSPQDEPAEASAALPPADLPVPE